MESLKYGKVLVCSLVCLFTFWSIPAKSGWLETSKETNINILNGTTAIHRDVIQNNATWTSATVQSAEVKQDMRLAELKSPAERKKEAELEEQTALKRLEELKKKIELRNKAKRVKMQAEITQKLKEEARLEEEHKLRLKEHARQEDGKYKVYVDAIIKRIKELDELPSTISTLKEIQDENDNFRIHGMLLDGKRVKLKYNDKYGINKILFRDFGHGSYMDWLKSLANNKAAKVIKYEISKYPATADGLLQFMTNFEYEAKLYLRKSVGYSTLNKTYSDIVGKKATEYYVQGIKAKTEELKLYKGKDYSSFNDLKNIDIGIVYLKKIRDAELYDEEVKLLNSEYNKTYNSIRDSMIDESTPVLVGWINSMPASSTAMNAIDKFTEEAFGKAGYIPERFTKLNKAVKEKQNTYNPDGYDRPDIIFSLQKEYWHEVKLQALEDIAYFTTTFNTFNNRCPGIISDNDKRLFASRLGSRTMSAMSRIRSGQFLTKKENKLAVVLVLNAIANRPGCKVDSYGNVTTCISEEESKSMTKALMTSAAALNDIDKFLSKNSCSSKPAKKYILDMVELSSGRTDRRSAGFVPDFPYK